jgi:CBS-domain-containing membrane protein
MAAEKKEAQDRLGLPRLEPARKEDERSQAGGDESEPRSEPPTFSSRERTVREIVREGVPVVHESTGLSALPDLFAKSRAPAVVLLDTDEKPMGAVTPVDLFGALAQHGPVSLADIGMRDAANARVVYLRSDTRISSALRLYASERPEFILVVDETGRLTGLVSPTELLEYLTQ